jgi:ABC-type multidrug transport system ATPase subunit
VIEGWRPQVKVLKCRVIASCVIEAEGLVKTYGIRRTTLAVDQVSFSVSRRARFGVLGADGAGKTTILRILASVLRPTEGTVRIGGHDAASEPARVHELVGFLPQNLDLRVWSSGTAYLRFWARAGGLPSREQRPRIQELNDLLNLARYVEERPAEYPIFAQKLLGLAAALLLDPDVLLLDEPMIGLEDANRQWFAGLLKRLANAGTTVVLSSPLLVDIQAAASQVALMADGHLTKVYSVEELLSKIGEGRNARMFIDCDPLPPDAVAALKRMKGIVDVQTAPSATIVYYGPTEVEVAAIRKTLESLNVQVRGIRQARLKLGDVFKTLQT